VRKRQKVTETLTGPQRKSKIKKKTHGSSRKKGKHHDSRGKGENNSDKKPFRPALNIGEEADSPYERIIKSSELLGFVTGNHY